MLVIIATFYTVMVLGGYAVELLFGVSGLIPTTRNAKVLSPSISWNYTTFLNIIFLTLAGVLLVRLFTTGGRPMLTMMGSPPDPDGAPSHASGHH